MEKENILWLPDYSSLPKRQVQQDNVGFAMCTTGY
jgi:hypothetical protein